jgi:hypothetical protein
MNRGVLIQRELNGCPPPPGRLMLIGVHATPVYRCCLVCVLSDATRRSFSSVRAVPDQQAQMESEVEDLRNEPEHSFPQSKG